MTDWREEQEDVEQVECGTYGDGDDACTLPYGHGGDWHEDETTGGVWSESGYRDFYGDGD